MHMRPTRLASTFLSALIAIFAQPSFADDDQIPYIEVSATGTADAVPDTALVSLTVLRIAKTARAALDANNKAMAAVQTEMTSAGIAARDLQTSEFSLRPQYVHARPGSDGQRPPPVLTGYAASNQLAVRIRDLARAGDILDKAVSLGVNRVGGIRFVIDDPAPLLTRARQSAVRNAVVKAKSLTSAAGVTLGKILFIHERNNTLRPVAMLKAPRMMESAPAVPIAAGEISYSVTVSMRWAVKS